MTDHEHFVLINVTFPEGKRVEIYLSLITNLQISNYPSKKAPKSIKTTSSIAKYFERLLQTDTITGERCNSRW